ncbi:MAG: hypothetical protein R3321_10650, partial [Nitrososphaeraceae archaeon]|nr:hypothetical protein [Nitrososphaeraceae archaeon]
MAKPKCNNVIEVFRMIRPLITTWQGHYSAAEKIDSDNKLSALEKVAEDLAVLNFDNALKANFKYEAQKHNLQMKDMMKLIRLSITGSDVGVGIFEIINFLGHKLCSERVRRVVDFTKNTKTIGENNE